jgi:CRP/FNR family transcriptional regulator, cyclic AMP receptor protein
LLREGTREDSIMTTAGESALETRTAGRTPLLAGLDDEIIEAFVRHARQRRYAHGSVIFHKDDPGSLLYVIISGKVKISMPSMDGKDLVLNILSAGESFGEMALFDEQPRSASAEAMDDAVTLTLGRPDFMGLLERYPALAMRVIELLTRRLRATDALAQDASLLDLPGRLARRLLELAETYGDGDIRKGPIVVNLKLTQTELAALVGATRVATNRVLQRMQQRGVIAWEPQRITLKKPADLRKMAVI